MEVAYVFRNYGEGREMGRRLVGRRTYGKGVTKRRYSDGDAYDARPFVNDVCVSWIMGDR